ncbi:MAG: ribonuclease P protein component [Desulfuromonadales bacterium]|nr:ribonuclease P protein component [Desulfuromonadales bacterium]
MACGENAFPSAYRLLRSGDFQRVRGTGRKFHTTHFVVYLVGNAEGVPRLGITASRKVGGAVQRNRIKRLLREFFRQHRDKFPPSVDISVIAKVGAASLELRQVSAELHFLTTLAERGGTWSTGFSSP